jgi:hypothetical protein
MNMKVLLLGALLSPTIAQGQSADIGKLLMPYGVPSSPAFELLPGKVSEVTHVTTSSDVSAAVSALFKGSTLQSGAAIDSRPLAWFAGSLEEYQKNPFNQIKFRTVLSLGTASQKDSKNILLAAGVRIPIIDRGDPRLDLHHQQNLINTLEPIFAAQPPADITLEEWQKKVASTDANAAKVRAEFIKKSWNKGKLDVGFAKSTLVKSGKLDGDSLKADRTGLWIVGAIPTYVLGTGQLSGMLKSSWANPAADTLESSRQIYGARYRAFITPQLAASAELAHIRSNYKAADFDEGWNHLALVVEIDASIFKVLGNGWIQLAYGGDSAHRTDKAAKFSFLYALAQNRLLK